MEGIIPSILYEEVQEEVQEGSQEEEVAVPEDLLRARLPRLNGPSEALAAASRPALEPGWRSSKKIPAPDLKQKGGES